MTVHQTSRRGFLAIAGVAVLVPIAGVLRRLRASEPMLPEPDVDIAEFTDAGERKGIARVAKVVKSDAEWKSLLSPLAFDVARRRGTEMPFSGEYWNLHDKGIFRCVCCGTALFNSAAKFDSGTGWPSFWEPIAEENVRHGSPSRGFTDSEVTCRRCDAHLGDLFDDGPKPAGLRYCIDSVSLKFARHTGSAPALVGSFEPRALAQRRPARASIAPEPDTSLARDDGA